MTRVDGAGSSRPPEDHGDKKPEKKKKPGAPEFKDVLSKKSGDLKSDALNQGVSKDAKKGFEEKRGAVEGERDLSQTTKGEKTKQERISDDNVQAVGQTEQSHTMQTQEAKEVQGAKPTSLPPELVKRIVESVRVGQNRVGATEMQIGLKSTVFEGMNLKVSSQDGIVNVIMEVEQIAAKDQLEAEIAKLQDQLEAKGLVVGDIEVQLSDSGSSSFGSRQGDSGDSGFGDRSGGRGEGGQGSAGGADRTGGSTRPRRDTNTDYTL
jgi:flagellar hook-length control protein FliK